MLSTDNALTAEGLSFSLDSKPLLRDISLKFTPGVLYGVLGPNGSGKSTLLKTLTGIWQATSGRVTWNGEDLFKKSRKVISSLISLVPQNPQVHFDFTVSEMVAMGRYPYEHQQNKHCEELLEWALQTVDIWHLKNRSILKLSHGEQKRVYIARALITESPVLLLDEPTASLDIHHQLAIWFLLKRLVDQGKIIVVTNHDLVATERFCDEVAIINQGRCLTRGLCDQVLIPSLLEEVFAVEENMGIKAKHFNLKKGGSYGKTY